MKSLLLALCCLAVLGGFVAAQPRSTTTPTRTPRPNPTPAADNSGPVVEDNEVVRINTNLVMIPVSVTDRRGRFMQGLKKEDFRVFEDGVVQQVEMFAASEQPFTVILLMDVSRSTQYKIEEIQDAAIAFIDQLRPQDRVMVIAFDDDAYLLSEPTGDMERVRYAIRQTRFGSGTKLYDTVNYVLKFRLKQIEGRKAIVLFTDGVDSTSRMSDSMSTVLDA